MKKRNRIAFLAALLLCLSLLSLFVGCSRGKQENVTIYPCYFNRDVEGVDCSAIRAALEKAGWVLKSTDQNEYDHYKIYHYALEDTSGEQTKVLALNEHANAEAAKQHYDQMWQNDSLAAGFANNNHFFEAYLRISDCSIMALGNAHVDLLELLDLGTVQPLEISLDNSYEMCREAKGVDIAAVKAAMEADGYVFYETVFVSGQEETVSYVIVSPGQDRTYAYTLGEAPKWGIPGAYREYKRLERLADFGDSRVGVHFVGFEDGSCILCFGNSFEEIEEYFVH